MAIGSSLMSYSTFLWMLNLVFIISLEVDGHAKNVLEISGCWNKDVMLFSLIWIEIYSMLMMLFHKKNVGIL